ncbi:MAG: hypothetical protein AAF518_16925, partial [Spirochaetota bacterium]
KDKLITKELSAYRQLEKELAKLYKDYQRLTGTQPQIASDSESEENAEEKAKTEEDEEEILPEKEDSDSDFDTDKEKAEQS